MGLDNGMILYKKQFTIYIYVGIINKTTRNKISISIKI